MPSTLQDIAAQSGMSVTTVSRVLNKQARKYRISRSTETLVLAAARELNYRPNPLARGLRMQRTQTIGLVVPDISNPFFATVIKTIQKVAHRMEYSLVVCDTDESLTMEREQIELLHSKSVDGLIVLPVGQKFDHLQALVQLKLPLVVLDRSPEGFDADSVVIDNFQGAFQATEYLIEMGHRRIAVIQGLQDTYTNDGRLAGYRAALEKHGVPVDESLVVGRDFRKESAYVETKFLLSKPHRPTAIFAFGDLLTFGAMHAIAEEGLSIPEDVSLVAFDDIDFAQFLKCPLTAVAQPKEMMGEVAIKLLGDILNGNATTSGGRKRIVLQAQLIKRASVRNVNADA
jgi:LacI family transcriptional regulator